MTQNTPRFALLFAGQGSQNLGMLKEFADVPVVVQTFAEASEALGFDVWQILSDESRLHETQFTQPVLLTSSIALWRLIKGSIPTPSYMAGHSLGEYSALCASGVLSLADAVRLVHARGIFMTEAVLGMDTQMAAVLGLDDEQVADLCRHASGTVGAVDAANFNSPGQVVIAGTKLGVAEVIKNAEHLGKKCVPLKVSVPSHCQLMIPAGERLKALLEDTAFMSPCVPVIQNLNAVVNHSTQDIKTALIRQLSEPVQWTKTMKKLADNQTAFLVECSCGTVLTNLAKRQEVPLPCMGVDKPEKIQKLLERFDES